MSLATPKANFKNLALILITVIISACNAAPTNPLPQRVTDAKLKAGSAIPAPTGDVILTVDGKIGTKNVGDTVQMDLATIESVGQYDYKMQDPFDKVATIFRGPLMSDLLELWNVHKDATTLTMIALN